MGIGLFITKKIVNSFGWEINAGNWEQGACFTLEIPLEDYNES